jgi:serine/threonine protein kinase
VLFRSGAFDYALCLHYGIGVEANLKAAAKYYELAARLRKSPGPSHSFRCVRSQNKAEFTHREFPEFSSFRLEVLEECRAMRPFRPNRNLSDNVVGSLSSGPGRSLGFGGSAEVFLETDSANGQKVAVKYIFPTLFDQQTFLREIEALTKLHHPCVLSILGYVLPSGQQSAEIHTEFAESGSLAAVMKRAKSGSIPGFWNPTGKGIIISGVVLGMIYVHSEKYIHRDLKPMNIMINGKGRALIGDFGASRYEDNESTQTPGSETGTVHYAAPELFQETIPYTNKVDVFSFGSILYEILVGSPVFDPDEPPFPVMRVILAGEMPPVPDSCGKYMQQLITRCWSKEPESRPSFPDIFEDFRAHNFAIFPDADGHMIRDYVCGILAWEADGQLRGERSAD